MNFRILTLYKTKWLNLLVNKNENICCVGDDDQSIYSWRGAEIKNFLTFDKIYKNCKVFASNKITVQQKKIF